MKTTTPVHVFISKNTAAAHLFRCQEEAKEQADEVANEVGFVAPE